MKRVRQRVKELTGSSRDGVKDVRVLIGDLKGEAAVLVLVVRGKASKTIAATLDCAERTVEFHVTAILVKAEVESRAELIARFFIGG